jgi:hypothetical protein
MIELSNEMYVTKDIYRALVDYGDILVINLLRKSIWKKRKMMKERNTILCVKSFKL